MNQISNNLAKEHEIEPGWPFAKVFEVRWGEVDAYQHTGNLTYLIWCEEVRNAYLAEAGFPVGRPSDPGPVIREVGCSYERPTRLRDEVIATARISQVGRTSFRMEYAIWSHGLVARAHAVCVWFVNSSNQKQIVPDSLRQLAIERDGAINS